MIEVKHISKSYGDTEALKNVSLKVQTGELFGLIGPDGAGKTTLMRILMTLLLPDKGDAEMMFHNVVEDHHIIRNIAGYMPGRFSLYQDLTVEENLSFFATVFGTTVEENYDLIKDIYVQIEPFKTRRAGKLSGGMKQKLALSCAMIHKPEVLILDEPTTGVDAVSRKEFWDMLKRLKKSGITILVSTPYMDEAEQCDRIALIDNGIILGTDTPAGLKQSFNGRLWQYSTQKLYQSLKLIREIEQVESVHTFGQFLHLTTGVHMSEEDLTAALSSKINDGFELKEMEPGIEDIFMQKMAEHE
ncbi:ABC transporter ATP-binding protein [Saccharicrinis sp. FJH54]|uniref:ABC transporter ATP-binding protein n=1 Tax=Saccharicrinis sp. FJH54 TaxID=3344665 RepID=UPI0035D3F8EC